ncbi:MAG: TIGR02757 family protein [bacterium]
MRTFLPAAPGGAAAKLNDVRGVAEAAYRRYHRLEYLHPDPLEVVHAYSRREDREVVALTASALALGRVDNILKACREVLSAFPRPCDDLRRLGRKDIAGRLGSFVYRFFRTSHMTNFLFGIGEMLRRHGSLQEGFLAGYSSGDETVVPALTDFVGRLSAYAEGEHGILLSFPEKGSAGKRLHLFLRWMVRRDVLDPGDWTCVDPAKLLVPVDTHMLRIAHFLGITARKSADRAASEEITAFFRGIDPADPAKYDFSLTRAGIHPELSRQELGVVLRR